MKSKYLAIAACVLFIFAVLSPFRYAPLAGFWSQTCAFAALLCMAALLWNSKFLIPKLSLTIVAIATIPILQYAFGQIVFFQDAFFSTLYLLAFWFAVVVAYSLSKNQSFTQHAVMSYTAYAFLSAGVVSCIFALCQWFSLEPKDYLIIIELKGNRPYANMGQPNHLATLLFMSLIACLYLFEREKLKPYLAFAFAVLILFCIALTQSRTAWLASAFIFAFLLFKLNKNTFRLNRIWLVGFFALFWLFLLGIPELGEVASHAISADTVETASFAERSTSGFERIQIWQQLLTAALERPWTGYGWYQVTAAQYAATLDLPVHVWLTSSHDIMLDILVWCGFVLGGAIILYAVYFFLSLIFKAKSLEALCASLMIAAILIHGLLEYPLFYAYFLLPLGVLAGIAYADQPLKTLSLSRIWLRSFCAVFVLILLMVCAQYIEWLNATTEQRIGKAPQKLYTFDKLAAKEKWWQLDPHHQVSQQQLIEAKQIVQSYLTARNLRKYATLLAYNGHISEAEQQLKILAVMYHEQISIAELFADKDTAHN